MMHVTPPVYVAQVVGVGVVFGVVVVMRLGALDGAPAHRAPYHIKTSSAHSRQIVTVCPGEYFSVSGESAVLMNDSDSSPMSGGAESL
jgi:hypothetical protein